MDSPDQTLISLVLRPNNMDAKVEDGEGFLHFPAMWMLKPISLGRRGQI